jgi:lipid-binding SYLF domain-containing protein
MRVIVGGEAGSGVMSCRRAKGWSAPVFMHLAKGSFGLQIGAEQVDLVPTRRWRRDRLAERRTQQRMRR